MDSSRPQMAQTGPTGLKPERVKLALLPPRGSGIPLLGPLTGSSPSAPQVLSTSLHPRSRWSGDDNREERPGISEPRPPHIIGIMERGRPLYMCRYVRERRDQVSGMISCSSAQAAITRLRSMKVSASAMTAAHSGVVVATAAASKLSNQTSPSPV